eukprot:Blabericola_migrator_1__101@NODE_1025_length_5666_cov_91_655296_g705_i0_p2_GENE_NODE_1025_length_5666_cov_91_655296_g705_i0NODE_1025_length_5666_cov_91_655296_g705_i0_p2_ORF_typecomplete_len805_score99_01Glyco_hydro_3_C/PF01915_22/0_21_NODE_1025_length_5666_cov_91_655296_g705_i030865500
MAASMRSRARTPSIVVAPIPEVEWVTVDGELNMDPETFNSRLGISDVRRSYNVVAALGGNAAEEVPLGDLLFGAKSPSGKIVISVPPKSNTFVINAYGYNGERDMPPLCYATTEFMLAVADIILVDIPQPLSDAGVKAAYDPIFRQFQTVLCDLSRLHQQVELESRSSHVLFCLRSDKSATEPIIAASMESYVNQMEADLQQFWPTHPFKFQVVCVDDDVPTAGLALLNKLRLCRKPLINEFEERVSANRFAHHARRVWRRIQSTEPDLDRCREFSGSPWDVTELPRHDVAIKKRYETCKVAALNEIASRFRAMELENHCVGPELLRYAVRVYHNQAELVRQEIGHADVYESELRSLIQGLLRMLLRPLGDALEKSTARILEEEELRLYAVKTKLRERGSATEEWKDITREMASVWIFWKSELDQWVVKAMSQADSVHTLNMFKYRVNYPRSSKQMTLEDDTSVFDYMYLMAHFRRLYFKALRSHTVVHNHIADRILLAPLTTLLMETVMPLPHWVDMNRQLSEDAICEPWFSCDPKKEGAGIIVAEELIRYALEKCKNDWRILKKILPQLNALRNTPARTIEEEMKLMITFTLRRIFCQQGSEMIWRRFQSTFMDELDQRLKAEGVPRPDEIKGSEIDRFYERARREAEIFNDTVHEYEIFASALGFTRDNLSESEAKVLLAPLPPLKLPWNENSDGEDLAQAFYADVKLNPYKACHHWRDLCKKRGLWEMPLKDRVLRFTSNYLKRGVKGLKSRRGIRELLEDYRFLRKVILWVAQSAAVVVMTAYSSPTIASAMGLGAEPQ